MGEEIPQPTQPNLPDITPHPLEGMIETLVMNMDQQATALHTLQENSFTQDADYYKIVESLLTNSLEMQGKFLETLNRVVEVLQKGNELQVIDTAAQAERPEYKEVDLTETNNLLRDLVNKKEEKTEPINVTLSIE